MVKDIKDMSLDSLFTKLHQLMSNLVKDIEGVLGDNEEMGMGDIKALRDHINHKLAIKEEVSDNQKILLLLNLFSEDKAVIEIIREDAEEWLELLNAIESNITGGDSGRRLNAREEKEVKEIKRLTGEIKTLIRQEQR
jgi:hypothetical protein